MWYVVAAAVWLVVGFAFCWLWGSLARFSGDEDQESMTVHDYGDDPLDTMEAGRQIVALPASSQGRR